MTASKVLIVRPDGPAAFGTTPAQRLQRLAARESLTATDRAGEADVINRPGLKTIRLLKRQSGITIIAVESNLAFTQIGRAHV
jgi:hypothetical protein